MNQATFRGLIHFHYFNSNQARRQIVP